MPRCSRMAKRPSRLLRLLILAGVVLGLPTAARSTTLRPPAPAQCGQRAFGCRHLQLIDARELLLPSAHPQAPVRQSGALRRRASSSMGAGFFPPRPRGSQVGPSCSSPQPACLARAATAVGRHQTRVIPLLRAALRGVLLDVPTVSQRGAGDARRPPVGPCATGPSTPQPRQIPRFACPSTDGCVCAGCGVRLPAMCEIPRSVAELPAQFEIPPS
jgi:hypothetical protein